jgi:hypothetical protein
MRSAVVSNISMSDVSLDTSEAIEDNTLSEAGELFILVLRNKKQRSEDYFSQKSG